MIQLRREIADEANSPGMRTLELGPGWKMFVAKAAATLCDPKEWFDPLLFPSRMTLVRKDSGGWLQVENSAAYVHEAVPFAVFSVEPRWTITFFAREPFQENCELKQPAEKLRLSV